MTIRMTAGPTIDYEALAQEAMRGIVRAVLSGVAKNGLPGEHHFYIAFDTQAPGVILSRRLKEKYPEEMTIVLQHRFWDLAVTDERFEVKLTFDGIPERLVIPFTSVRVFFDPSVRYTLQFDDGRAAAEQGDEAGRRGGQPRSITPRTQGERRPRAPRRPRLEKGAEGEEVAASDPKITALDRMPRATEPAEQPAAPATEKLEPDAPATPAAPEQGAQVLSLDQFRKK